MVNKEFENIEQGFEILKEILDLRNQMGSALYWNILHDECCEIAKKLYSIGADKERIRNIFNGKGA